MFTVFLHNQPHKDKVCHEIMYRLWTSEKCYDVVRMSPWAFQGLCDILRRFGDLQDTQCTKAEKQVAKFVHILFSLFRVDH